MQAKYVRRGTTLLVALGLALAAAAPVAAQATGTITGRVTDSSTQRPMDNAQISIPGSGIGALANAAGQYLLLNVPAGEHRVQVQLIGYAVVEQVVTVASGQTAVLNFQLSRSAIELGEIVITGAGQATERRRLGNTVQAISVSEIENAPVVSASEVLQARIPGVDVQTTGGHAGSGAEIRIRGVGSLSQNNGPVIYVDGVRVTGGRGEFTTAASATRLDDLNPDNIERIEVLKGAAAATLYGTEASNGVIQIFTKRGRAGTSRWALSAGGGVAVPIEEPVLAGFALAEAATPGRDRGTIALNEYWGVNNQPFELYTFDQNPVMFETGRYSDFSLSNSGGSDRVQYFVVGRYSKEDGVLGGKKCELPDGSTDCFQIPGFDIFEDINELKQADANVSFQPADNLRLELSTRYVQRITNPQDNTGGAVAMSQLSKPETASLTNLTGARLFNTLKEGFQTGWNEETDRFGGSIKAAYSVTPQLNVNFTSGVDVIRSVALFKRPFGHNVDGFSNFTPQGFRQVTSNNTNEFTLEASVAWETEFTRDISSALVVGSQVLVKDHQRIRAEGEQFPGPGIDVVGGASIQRTLENIERTVNNGVFIQEQLGFRNFFFLTAGARLDRHSAFGENADAALYPKVSGSFVVSDLPGWNGLGPISTLRLRSAIGQSGLQPGSFDRFSTFAPANSPFGPGLVPSNLGNPDLKPEVSTEWEAGFEAGIFSDRVAFEATYWNRVTQDLLIARQFPVSGGFTAAQLDNVGEMKASGWDLGINGIAYQSGSLVVDLFANGAYLFQEVTDMGGLLPIRQPSFRNRGAIREGYSPQSLFGGKYIDAEFPFNVTGTGQPATRADMLAYLSQPRTVEAVEALAIGVPGIDGTLTDNYLGKSAPDWQGSFGTNITYGGFTLASNFAYKARNYHVTNHTFAFRDGNPSIGRNYPTPAGHEATLRNPASTPEERLEAVMWFKENAFTLDRLNGINHIVPADFVRWRELSVSWRVPNDVASRVGAESLTLTASGRNIALWTNYKGLDPETVQVDNIHAGHDAHIISTPRRFGLALRVNF